MHTAFEICSLSLRLSWSYLRSLNLLSAHIFDLSLNCVSQCINQTNQTNTFDGKRRECAILDNPTTATSHPLYCKCQSVANSVSASKICYQHINWRLTVIVFPMRPSWAGASPCHKLLFFCLASQEDNNVRLKDASIFREKIKLQPRSIRN